MGNGRATQVVGRKRIVVGRVDAECVVLGTREVGERICSTRPPHALYHMHDNVHA